MPDDRPASEAPDAPPEDALETALIALQKTFSRVSAQSRDVPPDQPRALIVGDVSFEMSTRVNKGPEDRLYVESEGDIAVTLSGTVRTDVREIVDEE